MNLNQSDMFVLVSGAVLSVIAWFIKRDLSRFEKTMDSHNAALHKHSEALSSLSVQVSQLVEFQKWVPQLQRFFGENGGHARIWRNIEDLQQGEQNTRDRFHWMMNKMAILKGSMEMQGMKCGDPAGWVMPDWKKSIKGD